MEMTNETFSGWVCGWVGVWEGGWGGLRWIAGVEGCGWCGGQRKWVSEVEEYYVLNEEVGGSNELT